MSDRSNRKAQTGQARTRKRRSKDEPIRLEDLIPKKDVTGGRRLVFGVTDEDLAKPRKKEE